VTATLNAMAVHAGFWAETPHCHVWKRAFQALAAANTGSGSGYDVWLQLRRYPATLLIYSLGIGAVEPGRLHFLNELLKTPIAREGKDDKLAVELLPPVSLIDRIETVRLLDGMERRHTPLNDWLHTLLRPLTKRLIPTDARYTLQFNKLEILMALSAGYHSEREPDWYWVPPGYGYRHDNCKSVLQEIEASLAKHGNGSPFVKSEIFGTSVAECRKELEAFNTFLQKLHREMR